MLATQFTHRLGLIWIIEDLQHGGRALLDRVYEVSCLAMFDLDSDASAVATNNRRALPHRLGHCEAETLSQGFLQDDFGTLLYRADLGLADDIDV